MDSQFACPVRQASKGERWEISSKRCNGSARKRDGTRLRKPAQMKQVRFSVPVYRRNSLHILRALNRLTG